jgi:pancreatic triacylglycerol lipase
MKVLFCLALFAIAVAAIPIAEERINGVNGWYIPQISGSMKWMNMKEANEMLTKLDSVEARDTNAVSFYLYTKSNPQKGQQILATRQSIQNSNFNPSYPTRFVIHGWTQSYTEQMYVDITNAWLSKGNFNVIVVDWARARSVEYASSVLAVPGAGKKVGDMILFLQKEFKMSLNTLHVIGHSLGAQVAGHTGKTVGAGKINTIVGLDPAFPLFSYNSPDKRLASTDGFYVESIHTNGGKLGFLKPIGKASFYPNGGEYQPGCGTDTSGMCSHQRSVEYYVEATRKNNFPSMKCKDYSAAVQKSCGSTYSTVKMASSNNPASAAGDFFVPVNSKPPFGMN